MANSSLNVIALDFATLKNSLKTYLQSQAQFKDWDFDGSNMSVLLDLLAYNTFQNGFYLNMIASEMFLDSAQLRDSIISHAKELNYLPRSTSSAVANVSLQITTQDGSLAVVIPKYTSFTGRVGSNTYTFTTNSSYTAVSNSNIIWANNIAIYEGTLVPEQFVVTSVEDQQLSFTLSNPNIDINSLFVNVIEDGGSLTTSFSYSPSLFDLNGQSNVYFIEATSDGKYQIVFGDGVTGRQPKDGAVISAEYRVSNGLLANKISSFTIDGTVNGQSNIAIVVNGSSNSGAYAESAASIKFNSPRHFSTQERAVTATDYETLLQQNFPEIIAVSATGGENLSPPQYGKVSISVLLDNIDGLPDSKKAQYKSFLTARSPLSIEPIFTIPEIVYLDVDTIVNYNINLTSADTGTIRTAVINSILSYNNAFLDDFNVNCRYSQMVRVIDQTDSSIISNDTNIRMIKKTAITTGISQNYVIKFGQALIDQIVAPTNTTIESNLFYFNGQPVNIRDDGAGNLAVYTTTFGQISKLFACGTVNYDTGTISINNLRIDSIDSNTLSLYASPKSKDITSSGNVILKIDVADITTTINQLRE